MDRKGQYSDASPEDAPKVYSNDAFQGVSDYGHNEISLKKLILKLPELWRYLISKWVIIAIACVSGGIFGLAYAYSYKTLYTAELTFVLEGGRQSGGLGSYAGLASQFGIDMGGGGGGIFEGENLLALMTSRLMIERALLTAVNVNGREKTLAEYYIDMNSLRKKWAKENPKMEKIGFIPGADPSGFSIQQNSLISGFHRALISKNLFVDKKDKKSSIISMRVTSEDELFSKYFTEALAKEVSDFYIATKTKKSARNLTILRNQADSVRREFNAAISGVASMKDANPNANPSRLALQVPNQRRQVDAQANQALLMELMKNLAASQISLREETPLIQIIDKPVLPLPVQDTDKIKCLIIGGMIGGFIALMALLSKRYWESVMYN